MRQREQNKRILQSRSRVEQIFQEQIYLRKKDHLKRMVYESYGEDQKKSL
jgi:hypothetical protein